MAGSYGEAQSRAWEMGYGSIAEALDALGRIEAQRDAILLQARCWASEAKTQRATVQEVGSILGGIPDWGPIASSVENRLLVAAELAEKLAELAGAIQTINHGQSHALNIEGEDNPVFWQPQKWIQRLLDLSSEAERRLSDMSNEGLKKDQRMQLAQDRVGRVYVAGPMTGIVDYNFPAFIAAAEELRAQGFHVENPADHGVVEGAQWEDYLRYDLGKLATCETIYLLPGWSHSRGASLEVTIAQSLGFQILYAPQAEKVPGSEQIEWLTPLSDSDSESKEQTPPHPQMEKENAVCTAVRNGYFEDACQEVDRAD